MKVSKEDAGLINEAMGLYEMIQNVGCYGTKDLLKLESAYRKLEERGYLISESKKLSIRKED